LPYLALGVGFGIVATRSQIISWYRIQEMFRFHSFHMYGVILSAIVTAAIGIALIRAMGIKSLEGEPISIAPKVWDRGYRYGLGGLIFGLGWGLAGACPGPIFALIGNGVAGGFVVLFGALAGTWAYAALRSRLPH